MKKYLAFYENEWPANIAELTAIENKPFVGYLKGEGVSFTVIPKPATGPADNEIWYTSTDKQVVTPSNTDAFGVSIVSNEYNDGRGVITFDGPVTSIGEFAFGECYSLTSITLPNSIKSIGDAAFNVCSSLSSIAIPNSVTNIGGWVFEGCSSLSSITIPNSVTSIGNSNFGGCSSLTSIVVESSNTTYDSRENCNAIIETATNTLIVGCQNTVIPNSVTSVGDRAFQYCRSLTFVTIPNSVTNIGGWAFFGCSSLTSVTIPNSVTNIGNYAFNGCSSLTSVTIPNSVTSIGWQAFYNCSKLTKTNYTGDVAEWCNIKFRDWGANPMLYSHNFYINDQEIKDLVIPNSVDTITDYAFYECSSLTSVTIPENVTSIGGWAFFGCSYLTSVTIPNSIASIENYAFSGCFRLTSITYEGTQEQWNTITKGDNWNNQVKATYVQCTDGQVAL